MSGLAIAVVALSALLAALGLAVAYLLNRVAELQRELWETCDDLAEEVRARIIAQGGPRC